MISWIRRHYLISSAATLLVGVSVVYGYTKTRQRPSSVPTVTVTRQTITQTVSVVGTVDAAQRVKLSPQHAGEVITIHTHVGQSVVINDPLIDLDSRDERLALERAQATLAKAEADLNVRIAGISKENLDVLSATTRQKEAELKKAVDDAATARTDFAQTEKTQKQLVDDAITNVGLSSRSGFSTATVAMNDSDGILGYENQSLNDSFEGSLASKDPGTLSIAKDRYRSARDARVAAAAALSSSTDVEVRAKVVDDYLNATHDLLDAVNKVLEATVADPSLPPATLSTKQTTITTDQSSVITAQTSLEGKLQSLRSARLTQETSIQAAQSTITTRDNAVVVAKSAWESARASETAQRVAPRSVDVAALQALVEQSRVGVSEAQAALDDRTIRSPLAGTVSDIPVKVGQTVSANQSMIELLGSSGLEIKANVPEVDIAKVRVGQKAVVTLDAFSSSEKFGAVVVRIDPAQTVVEGVATYAVTFHFDHDDNRFKPGMTANIDMVTAERNQVLAIPQRAVHMNDGMPTVERRNSTGGSAAVSVQTGLIGSDGYIEIISGVQEGDTIIVSGQ